MFLIFGLGLVDTAGLGRFNFTSLPHQILMEALVENIPARTKFMLDEQNYKEVCQWKGITCSDADDVIHIYWVCSAAPFFPGGGSIDLHWVPCTVECLTINGNALEGSLDTASLPKALRGISLNINRLSGSVHLRTLPPHVELVFLSNNRFSGTLNFSGLPENLRVLELDTNAFYGDIRLINLSRSIRRIDLSGNNFKGSVFIEGIPESMEVISVTRNKIANVSSTSSAFARDRRIVTNMNVPRIIQSEVPKQNCVL